MCLSGISMGRYCWKSLAKNGGGVTKRKGDGHIEGLSIEKSFKPSAHYVNRLLVMMKVELEYKKHNFSKF